MWGFSQKRQNAQTINILSDCRIKENCHDMDRGYLNVQRTKWVARISTSPQCDFNSTENVDTTKLYKLTFNAVYFQAVYSVLSQ